MSLPFEEQSGGETANQPCGVSRLSRSALAPCLGLKGSLGDQPCQVMRQKTISQLSR